MSVQTASDDIARLRTVGRVGELQRAVRAWSGPAMNGLGIGHTRWATHGKVSEENAHPHSDCTGRISLVHNGIIENADALRVELTATGHTFASAVDSEVLCHLIEEELSGGDGIAQAVRAALSRVEGSWGLAVMERGMAAWSSQRTARRCSSPGADTVISPPATLRPSPTGPTSSACLTTETSSS